PIRWDEPGLAAPRLEGLPPHRHTRLALSRRFQITSIFPRLNVYENIRCSLLWSRRYRYSFWHVLGRQRALNEETERLLEELNLVERRDLPAGVLSYAARGAPGFAITTSGGARANLRVRDTPSEQPTGPGSASAIR